MAAILQILRCAFLFLFLLQQSVSQEDLTDSHVLTITDNNFDGIAASTKYLLVEFYAPWCGHCKQLAPEYEKAATALSNLEDVKLAKVDVTNQKSLSQRFNIRSLPTLLFFKNGEVTVYGGGRSAGGIEKWVRKNSQPLKVITSDEELDALRKQRITSVVIGSFVSRESDGYTEFLAVSNDPLFGELEFMERISPSLASSSISLISKDTQELAFSAESSLRDWLLRYAFPVVGDMNENDISRYEARKVPLTVLFFDPTNDEEKTAVLSIFNQVGRSLQQSTSFAATDGLPGIQSFKNLGYDGHLPVVAISGFSKRGANFYPIRPSSSVEEISTWVVDVLEGRIKPNLMSQPIPEKPAQPGEVTIVVGKTFKELVQDPTKDVLLEIYSTNCGHCKQLEPIYEQLAKSFEKDNTIRIAKIDGTANDIDYEFRGFPTILFYPANNKQPVEYSKPSRSLEDLKDFVISHSTLTNQKDEL